MNPGQNLIRRNSTDSSVTIPFERTFRDVDTNRPGPGTIEEEQFNFCGVRTIPFWRNFYSSVRVFTIMYFYCSSVDGHNTCSFQKVYPKDLPVIYLSWFQTTPTIELIKIWLASVMMLLHSVASIFFFFATISLFISTENDSIKNCVQNQVYVTVSIQIAVQWAIHLIVWHVLALIAYNNF